MTGSEQSHINGILAAVGAAAGAGGLVALIWPARRVTAVVVALVVLLLALGAVQYVYEVF